ncbi:MAG: DUF1549 domain-containing protein [Pirellulaceae bacterium]
MHSRRKLASALSSLFILAACGVLPLLAADSGPRLEVYPERIELRSADDFQSIIVQRIQPDGSTRDVAAVARFQVQTAGLARWDGSTLWPTANGSTELVVELEGLARNVPVHVEHAEVSRTLRFRNDVLPVLTRAGCNTGKCHGAASGKDGFRLSLFGYDPDGDHYRLTREIPGRRLNLVDPPQSLLLQKALGEVAHTGGQCLELDSRPYRTIVSWLEAGAPADPRDIPQPAEIQVFPPRAVFAEKGPSQRLLVMALYSDGSQRDVTDLAVFFSNNEASASVDEAGVVTSNGPGSAFIMARFDQFTAGASIVVRPGTPYDLAELPNNNYIDEYVQADWRELHLVPSEVCTDEAFLRRVYLDLIGMLPTPQQRRGFLNNQDPAKRARLVEQLLERDEFLDMWVMRFAELLQIRTVNGLSPKGLKLYDDWLRSQVRSGRTIDQIARAIIGATGGTFENPATNYYQTETTPQLLAENVAQAFLGMRIQCAQCHNHPFDRWTMDDYYGFASFFSQVGYKQSRDPREIMVFPTGTGGIPHPVGGRIMAPKYLGGDVPEVAPGDDRRQSLAEWLTSAGNEVFARNLANIVWSHFFGIGIVEPVDDVRVSNPPSNPELLDALGHRLADYQFDIRLLARDICQSRTYQLSTRRNASNAWDERHFSRARVRRLRAEVLLDCLNSVTGTEERFPGLPAGGRAVQIADGRTPNYFLTTFGRSSRQTPCSCEIKTSPTLSQALHLINGESTSGKIAEGGLVEQFLAEDRDPMHAVAQIYERCLTRLPTDAESAAIRAKLQESDDVTRDVADLFWALLNSNEFLFNH